MGQAVRLASNFVVLDDKFNANVVESSPDVYARIDEEFSGFEGHLLRKTSITMFVTPGEGTLNAAEPLRE